MTFCGTCGYEIKWRTIEGRRVPMGCACEYGEYGISQFLRDRAVPARCPKCGDSVFFVRHNGGSVWFDQLGDPWPKHSCFDEPEDNRRSERSPTPKRPSPTGPIREPGIGASTGEHAYILKLDVTDRGQWFLYVSLDNHAVTIQPETGFWYHNPEPGVGHRILLDREKSTIELLPSKAEYQYWLIDVSRCGECGKRFLNGTPHKENCAKKTMTNVKR